jgi:hypothetical protein
VIITLDGTPIRAALAGTAMPINPGKRHLVVRSDTHEKVFEVDVNAASGESAAVSADLGPKKVVAPPPVAVIAPPPPLKATIPSPLPPAAPPPVNRTSAFIAGGGAAALGIGALVTGLLAHGKYVTYLEQNADPEHYPRAARADLRDSGQVLALASTVLTLGAAVAGGVTIYLFSASPRGSQPAKKTALSPWVGPGGAGVFVSGAL